MGITSWRSKLRRMLKADGISPKQDGLVKSFKAQQEQEAAYDDRDRGIRSIPLCRIVGSVCRYLDFDSHFKFVRDMPSERLQWIRKAMREGRLLKPVELYQIKDEYYVLDGNHRISAAKELGHDEILAHIVEFIPSKDKLQNILYRQRAEFADRTQLPTEITLTEAHQYTHLIDQIGEHQAYLENEQGKTIPFNAAAMDWYRTVYRPLCTIITQNRLIDSFPERTVADLYAYMTFHQWKEGRKRRYGDGTHKFIEKNMEEFRKKMAKLQSHGYPEMKRGTTVFVLINVETKKEAKLFDRLYDLEEVKEIYSVHGNADLLVKVVLSRDLLSSDAEVISRFVHDKIRQLPGVYSTNTLIPGFSRTKPPEVGQDNPGEPK